MRRILLGLCVLFFLNAHGQEIPLPEKMPQDHPRVLTTPEGKKETWKNPLILCQIPVMWLMQ